MLVRYHRIYKRAIVSTPSGLDVFDRTLIILLIHNQFHLEILYHVRYEGEPACIDEDPRCSIELGVEAYGIHFSIAWCVYYTVKDPLTGEFRN